MATLTTEQQKYLNTLEDVAKLIQKTQVNLKKCPKVRLTDGYIRARVKCIEEYWCSFKQAHEMLTQCTPRERRGEITYFLNEDFFVVEDLYICLQADLTDMLIKPQPTSMETSSSSAFQGQCSMVKLPRIQLPNFTGKYEEWPTYQDMFTSLVHNNTSISDVQKLHYLKSSVTGEAEIILRHIHVTDSNYDQAWKLLKGRFGNKRVIVFSVLNKLFYQKKITAQTTNSVKTLLDTTTECINNLKNLKINTDSWDPIIIFLVIQKLDQESHKEWETFAYKEKSEEVPSWEELKGFLESKFRTLEMIQPVTNKDRTVKERSYHTVNVVKNKSCVFCSENHTLCHCKEFIKMDLTQRNNYVKEKQLCFNCLLPGHSVYKCKVPVTCRICRRRHHSLLHRSEASKVPTEPIQPSTSQQQEDNKEVITSLHVGVGVSGRALLATALVQAKGNREHATLLRVLVDQGSQASFISEKATQLLKLQRNSIEGTVTGVGSMQAPIKHVVQLNILSRRKPEFNMNVEAYVMPKQLTTRIPHETITVHNWQHLKGLDLADPEYNKPGPIDLLLGVKEYVRIVEQAFIKGPPGSPCAQKTTLGWILFGEINTTQNEHSFHVMHHQIDVNIMLKTLWEIDTSTRRKNTKEEQLCEDIYHKTYTRNEHGRFIVKLPFKTNCIQSTEGNTREIAKTRLIQLERRFNKQPKLKYEYEKVIDDYKNLGHIEEVPEKEIYSRKSVYLPHHPVLREDKETTKTRIVFDASCKRTNGISLNDELLPGPVLQEDLRSIIMRWRMHAVCFAADIKKMYRMVMLNKEDVDFHRILWRNNSNEEIKDYRLLTVTFGTTSAPYLAVKTLIQLAHEERDSYPVAADITLSDFYVDDIMSGCDTIEEAIEASNQLKAMLIKGGFELAKWSSNNIELMKSMDPHSISSNIQLDINLDGTVKALGITWNLSADQFLYKISLNSPLSIITKRNVLSDVQKLYDPLGWISPSIVLSKMFIQKLWLVGTHWDQPLSDELTVDWLKIRKDFENVNQISLNRWLHSSSSNIKAIQLHGFSDASIRAYAAVVYCRVEQQDGTVHTSLIASRTKVAPLKTISLPRLELCGALLLSRLLKQVTAAMKVPYNQTFCWTDSTIVLAWLHGEPQKWKTFVANRVVEIKDNTNSIQWHHVISQENPADIASRGMFLTELKKEKMWWKGPEWLSKNKVHMKIPENTDTDLELKSTCFTITITTTKENEEKPIWERFSSLTRMKRVLAYCRRLLNNKKKERYLTTNEMNTILQICIKYYQQSIYEREIESIMKIGKVRKSSSLIGLTPFLDENNLLRVGGRLQNANLPVTVKHPIIIPSNQHITTLLINEAHKQTLHGGIQVMMTYIRSNYWIIHLKSAVRNCIRNCKICIINKGKVNNQLMGELPAVRVTPQRAFLSSGVDYAGPVLIRTSKGRGHHATKGYICLFVCMVTRAIHLEAVTDLTSQGFLAAFRRFVARRGLCHHLFSDNGTNFIGAAKELKDLFKAGVNSISKEIAEHLASEGTTWHFIPPRMPNCGGLWEAGVQSAKRHLARVSKNTTLTYEEMATLLTQVEACLNSRPLCQLDNTIETMSPLTPGHFLIGEPLLSVPDYDYETSNINLLSRWQLVQRMTQEFWRRWHSEYLHTLQQRTKWQSAIQAPTVGDIVVIKEEGLPPARWLLGKIKTLHPGKDDLVTQGEATENTVNTSRDVFIIHNKKNVKITTSELTSEIENNQISCPRCRKKFEHALKLMQGVKSIDRKILMGMCDHCLKKKQTIRNQFCACEEIVKKFISVKGEQKEDIKKYFKIWLSKTGHVTDEITLNKPQQIKSRAYSDLQLNRDFNSLASRHEPEIKQMFYPESKLQTKLSETGLEGHVKQDVAFALPIEPMETSFAHTSHEGEKMDRNIPSTSLVESEKAFVESHADKGILKSSIEDTKQGEIFEKYPSMDAKEELKRRHDLSLRQMMTLKIDAGVPLPSSKKPDIYETPKIAPWEQKDPTPKHHVESETNIKIPSITKHYRGPRGTLEPKKVDKYQENKIENGLLDFEEGLKQDKELKDHYNADEESSEKTKKQIQPTVKSKREAVEPLFSSFFFSKEKEKKKGQQINVTSSHLIKEAKDKKLAQAQKKELAHAQKKELAQAQRKELAQAQKKELAQKKEKSETRDKEDKTSGKGLKIKSVKEDEVTKKAKNSLKEKRESRVNEDTQKNKKKQELQNSMDTNRATKGRENPLQEKDATSKEGKATKNIKYSSDSIKDEVTKKAKNSLKEKRESRVNEDTQKNKKKPELQNSMDTNRATKGRENPLQEKDATSKEGKATKNIKYSSDSIKVSMSKVKISISKEKQVKEKESKSKHLEEEPTKGLIEMDDNLKKILAERAKERELAYKKAQEAKASQAKLKEQAKCNVVQGLEIKDIKVAKDNSSREILNLIKIKQVSKMQPENISRAQKVIHRSHHTKSGQNASLCQLCLNSDLEILLHEIKRLPMGKTDIIIGEKIVKNTQMPRLEKTEEPEGVPILYQKHFFAESEEQLKELQIIPQETDPLQKQILTKEHPLSKKDAQEIDKEGTKGVIRYALSDRTFIDKGWTVLPTEKVVRKMNVYRMRPAQPEFDWFEHNKNKRLMTYNTGERLAEFDDNGQGRWYYRSGQLALDYYDAKELHAQQRYVVYSSGEPDERGRTHPVAILAMFDYLGNGVVFDHAGKIRLKYNQTEGVVLDRAIGPVSHWQWHALNDPPVLQQVMVDTQMAHKDPNIVKLGDPNETNIPPQHDDMLAIEFDNFIKEKSKKLFKKFEPFQIKTKALKINKYFSLKVLDQSSVYLIFRDGSTNLKLNIGMVLDNQEIIDTDTAEVGEVSNNLERFPARTDSLEGLQRSVGHAQRYERRYVERQRWLRHSVPCASADKLTAATSPPMRVPLRTVPSRTLSTTGYCTRKPTNYLYYDTRLLC